VIVAVRSEQKVPTHLTSHFGMPLASSLCRNRLLNTPLWALLMSKLTVEADRTQHLAVPPRIVDVFLEEQQSLLRASLIVSVYELTFLRVGTRRVTSCKREMGYKFISFAAGW
jgi:hypothetical protein